MKPTEARPLESVAPALGWRYGFLGLPLAFLALPLYVHLPHYYASEFGLTLSLIGAILLWTRGLDALIDPWLGRFLDTRFSLGNLPHRKRMIQVLAMVSALALLLGFATLWWPQPSSMRTVLGLIGLHLAPQTVLLASLVLTLFFTYTAYSVLSILHQTWGARMGGNELVRSRIVAWREGFALGGVVLSSVLASQGSMVWTLIVLAVSLVFSLWALRSSLAQADVFTLPAQGGENTVNTQVITTAPNLAPVQPWRNPSFRRLMFVFILNGIASAIPATLLPFFVSDALQAPGSLPLFLLLYFLCAALSIPLWLRALTWWTTRITRLDKTPQTILMRNPLALLWLLGMLLSIVAFVAVLFLGKGDAAGFALVCALTGLALGADLAMPSALLTGVVQKAGHAGAGEGQYFGWWSCANKLNLALAAGLGLPLLEFLGYQAGSSSPEALRALTLAYVALPCLLKACAALLLLRFDRQLYTHAAATSPPTQTPIF